MSKTVCDKEVCCGCLACQVICPKGAVNVTDEMQYTEAVINEDLCVDCNLCRRVCPNHNIAKQQRPIKWYQGWSVDSEVRSHSSSGGGGSDAEPGIYS